MIDTSRKLTSLLCSAALVAILGGCSTLEKAVAGKSAAGGAGQTAGVYYAGSADLPLYRTPGGALIGRLPRYAKLYRSDLQRGFAHVRVEATGEAGWVENAKLIWRLPAHESSEQVSEPLREAEAEAVPAAPVVVESPEPERAAQAVKPQQSPSPAAASSSSAPAKSTVAPSIFNPY